MLDKLDAIEKHYDELTQLMAEPDVVSDLSRLQTLAKEHSSIEDVVDKYRQYKMLGSEILETEKILADGGDPDMALLARQEITQLKSKREELLDELKVMLMPSDENEK
jgi:peptide chain release factor 1